MTIGNVPPTEPAPPQSATSTLTPNPTPAARDRLTHEIEKPTSLWGEVKKTAIPALITGFFGYVGALIIPPTAVYDMVFRQNPNDLGGTWYGAVAGSPAILQLVDHGRLLEGTLTFRSGLPNSREIKVQGNHDFLSSFCKVNGMRHMTLKSVWHGSSAIATVPMMAILCWGPTRRKRRS